MKDFFDRIVILLTIIFAALGSIAVTLLVTILANTNESLTAEMQKNVIDLTFYLLLGGIATATINSVFYIVVAMLDFKTEAAEIRDFPRLGLPNWVTFLSFAIFAIFSSASWFLHWHVGMLSTGILFFSTFLLLSGVGLWYRNNSYGKTYKNLLLANIAKKPYLHLVIPKKVLCPNLRSLISTELFKVDFFSEELPPVEHEVYRRTFVALANDGEFSDNELQRRKQYEEKLIEEGIAIIKFGEYGINMDDIGIKGPSKLLWVMRRAINVARILHS